MVGTPSYLDRKRSQFRRVEGRKKGRRKGEKKKKGRERRNKFCKRLSLLNINLYIFYIYISRYLLIFLDENTFVVGPVLYPVDVLGSSGHRRRYVNIRRRVGSPHW